MASLGSGLCILTKLNESFRVCAALPQELSEAEAKEYLLSNAVSMAYAHAKSCFMTITGLSPMWAAVLPSISPARWLVTIFQKMYLPTSRCVSGARGVSPSASAFVMAAHVGYKGLAGWR